MPVLGGELGYRLLRRFAPGGQGTTRMDASVYAGKSKIRVLLGDALLDRLKGRDVVDFGCGAGGDSVELALAGARSVTGVDIQEDLLKEARERAADAGVSDRVHFVSEYSGHADAIVSIDAFEHFDDPGAILRLMRKMLAPGGEVIASFGPTWYHPLGGHLFSPFPWAHLVFSEQSLIRWRSDFKSDGATRFAEVAGGLNQMTIRRFRRLVAESGFRAVELEPVPIQRLRWLHNLATEEFTSAIVRARLVSE
jgi:SAM-dependent methyltransferase